MDIKNVNEKAEELRKQLVDLWGKTVNQLEDISKTLYTSGLARFKVEHTKLLEERDRWITRLGEETYKALDSGKVKMPKQVTQTYLKVRKVMDRIMIPKGSRSKSARKPARKSAKKA